MNKTTLLRKNLLVACVITIFMLFVSVNDVRASETYEEPKLNNNSTEEDTSDDYYEISDADDLYWFAGQINNAGNDSSELSLNAKLTADITLNQNVLNQDGFLATDNKEQLKEWTPIGTLISTGYRGTFDGNDKTIYGLYYEDAKKDSVGLFANIVEGACIKNLTIKDSYIKGHNFTGMLVGDAEKSSSDATGTIVIDNCHNYGTVVTTGNSGGAGGLVGSFGTMETDSMIKNCSNYGMVRADEGLTFNTIYIGGVVGFVRENADIVNCANYGQIQHSYGNVGGITGFNSGHIERCMNAGIVQNIGNDQTEYTPSYYGVGGIAGDQMDYLESKSWIENCYNTGEVIGTEHSAGGICGINNTAANDSYWSIINNCHNVGSVTGGDSCTGGIVGASHYGDVLNCYYNSDIVSNEKPYISSYGTYDVQGKTSEQFEKGIVAYRLQKNQTTQDVVIWGQNVDNGLKNQGYPVFDDSARVYATEPCNKMCSNDSTVSSTPVNHSGGTATCLAQAICDQCGEAYGDKDKTNHENKESLCKEEEQVHTFYHPCCDEVISSEKHVYDNGFCMCGSFEAAVWKADEQYYEISNAGQLYWFAKRLENDSELNGVLVSDIVVNKNVLNADGSLEGDETQFRQWKPMSTEGSFDGKGHTISGLVQTMTGESGISGLFAATAETAVISNLGVVDSYFTGEVAAGIVGLNMGFVKNCYFTGKILGEVYQGAIAAAVTNIDNIENCYYQEGSITNGTGIGFVIDYATGEPLPVETDKVGTTTAKPAEDFSSGKMSFIINGGTEQEWEELKKQEDNKNPPAESEEPKKEPDTSIISPEKYLAYPKEVKLSQTSIVYSGKKLEPTVTVLDEAGNLISSEFYTVAYKNNKNVGTATVTVVFGGKYKEFASLSAAFKITRAKVSSIKVKDATYTGKRIIPVFTTKEGAKLGKSEYKIKSIKNNKAIGKATVKVQFKGKNVQKKTKTFTFKILPKATYIIKLTKGKRQLKVTWKAQKKQITGYQIQYSTNKKFTKRTTKSVHVKAGKTSVIIKKLKSRKTYYVRVRTYKKVKKITYYSSWSKVKNVKTK